WPGIEAIKAALLRREDGKWLCCLLGSEVRDALDGAFAVGLLHANLNRFKSRRGMGHIERRRRCPFTRKQPSWYAIEHAPDLVILIRTFQQRWSDTPIR